MSQKDYYEVLDVSKSASTDEIKTAYRKLAMKYHPDRNPDDPQAEDKFKEASVAYDVLSDTNKRQRYDQYGFAGVTNTTGGYDPFSNINDIFSHFSDILGGGGFGDIFGGRQGRSRRSSYGERGSDVKIKMPLTLEEIAFGVERTIKIKRLVSCPKCKGSGAKAGSSKSKCPTCGGSGEVRNISRSMFGQFVNITQCPTCSGSGEIIKEKCEHCNGDGRIPLEDTFNVTIPSGVEESNYIPLHGKGNAGKNGGDAGDLLVIIAEKPHEHFKRMGDNVLYSLNVTFPDLAVGSEFEIPILDGMEKIKIDAGSQPNDTIKLSNKGIKGLHTGRRGDFIVLLNLIIPKKLSAKEKELITELSGQENFSNKNIKKSRGFFK
ncbi:MAG: molecular chaperone DnaJ [Ignavibacteria bacterium]|jgi:molecular chaperone DnaJ|nr:molecular chaperone DnaJ [Ignavibacteria bacterium]